MLTAAKTNPAGNTSAILPLVLVFLCGVSVGALVMNMGLHRSIHPAPNTIEAQNAITVERWKHELSLTDKQASEIVQLLDDDAKMYDNVVADGQTRIMQILNVKQQAKFQQMMKERR